MCYPVRMDNPTWSTHGPTPHQLAWSERVVDWVAMLQPGVWVLDLGQEAADDGRWSRFGCPERPLVPSDDWQPTSQPVLPAPHVTPQNVEGWMARRPPAPFRLN